MRDNRYCIPVKAEYKSQVSGMVHDQSSTGSTFFIEPAAVVNLNNQLKELDLQEQEEIEVILGDLSSQAAVHTSELAADQKIMTTLDFILPRQNSPWNRMPQSLFSTLSITSRSVRAVIHCWIRKRLFPLMSVWGKILTCW